MSDTRSDIIRRCASVGVSVVLDRVVCRVNGAERSFTAIVELAPDTDAALVGWQTGDPPRGVPLWVTVKSSNCGREVTIAKVSPSLEPVTWYCNGFLLMREVLAWMPMSSPPPLRFAGEVEPT